MGRKKKEQKESTFLVKVLEVTERTYSVTAKTEHEAQLHYQQGGVVNSEIIDTEVSSVEKQKEVN